MPRTPNDDYKRAVELHNQGEKYAMRAHALSKNNEPWIAVKRALKKAYKLVVEATELVRPHIHMEPARSQLFLNAAKLAQALSWFSEAEQHLTEALAGDPAPEMRQKLQVLRTQIQQIGMGGKGLTGKEGALN